MTQQWIIAGPQEIRNFLTVNDLLEGSPVCFVDQFTVRLADTRIDKDIFGVATHGAISGEEVKLTVRRYEFFASTAAMKD